MREICRAVIESPSFIIINGEAGGGKTVIAEALEKSGVDSQKTFNRCLFRSTEKSTAGEVRKYIISQLFGSVIFDPDDHLSDTAQMFEITKSRQVVIIDNIDYFDKGFLNELYRFYENYGQTYTLSVVITTGHLLTGLIEPVERKAPRYHEFTIRRLSEGECYLLFSGWVKQLSRGRQDIKILAPELLNNIGHQPAQIVKFAEKYVMDNFNQNQGNESAKPNKEEARFSSTVIDNDDVPRVIKHSIKKPSGPNKVLVIGIALVLTVALVGVIVMLLKKQGDTAKPEEVVVASQASSDTETVIQSPKLNDQNQAGGDMSEQEMVDSMMKGIDDGNPSDVLPPLENTQPVDIEVSFNDPEISGPEKKDPANASNVAPEQTGQVAGNTEPSQEEQKTDVKPVKEEKKADAKPVQEEKKADVKPAQEEKKMEVKPVQEEKKAEVKPTQEEKKADIKPVQKKTVQEKTAVKPSQEKKNNKATVEVGVVYPFAGDEKSSAKDSTVKTSGNYVVQVACNSSMASLQTLKNKLGSNAFIYERKNNSLKYVLVVGYYSTQQEARAAASKIGNGAWVKSAAAMHKEMKQ